MIMFTSFFVFTLILVLLDWRILFPISILVYTVQRRKRQAQVCIRRHISKLVIEYVNKSHQYATHSSVEHIVCPSIHDEVLNSYAVLTNYHTLKLSEYFLKQTSVCIDRYQADPSLLPCSLRMALIEVQSKRLQGCQRNPYLLNFIVNIRTVECTHR